MGVYYERKDAMLLYLREIRDAFSSPTIDAVIDGFERAAGLYRQLVFDVLAQGTDGWNHLWHEVSKEKYSEIIQIVEKIKEQEGQIVNNINQLLEHR